jgi:thiamine biosynthesis lipoprotein
VRRDRRTASFAAMGGTAIVSLSGDPVLLEHGRRRIEDLEAKWSRFRATSDVARLNEQRRRPVAVSPETVLLVQRSMTAWHLTSGAFDPTIHDALVRWGYDRDLADVRAQTSAPVPEATSGPAGILVDEQAGTVQLAGATGFDGGGIAKGLAADVVATELVELGADSAVVDLCGDVRVVDPAASGWTMGIEDPLDPDQDLLRLSCTGGGLATSSDRRRRWRAGMIDAHHLVDPSSGSPVHIGFAGVTVLAGEAWWAEALTKAVLVGGLAVEDLSGRSASGIGRLRCGGVCGTPDLLRLLGAAA